MSAAVIAIASAFVMAAMQAAPRDTRPVRDAERRASVSGVVLDEKGQPVPGAIMMLRGGPPPGVTTAITDVNGAFTFVDLPGGTFSLTAARSGYPSVEYGQTRPFSAGTRIVLVNGQSAVATVRMPRGAVIAGIVLDDNGDPVVGQNVTATRAQPSADPLDLRQVTTRTDNSGRYRIAELPAGTYLVAVRRTTAVYSWENEPVSEALRVTLSAGQERHDVELRVPPIEQTAPVTVAVSFPTGVARQRLDVRIVTADGRRRVGYSCFLDRDGSCTFGEVPAGRHSVVAETTGPPIALWSVTGFTSDGETPATISIAPEPGVRISGRITFVGTSPQPPPPQVSVRLVPEPDSIYSKWGSINTPARVAWDGAFQFPSVPPGRYTLSISGAFAPWLVGSAQRGDVDLIDTPIEVAREPIDGVIVTLTDVATELSGVVLRGGRPHAGVEVVAFPTQERYWRSTRRLQVARSDSEGRYMFTALPPGEYHVARVPVTMADSPTSTEMLPKLERLATVMLAHGERKRRDLVVLR